jgi:hypothetical protein
MKTIFKYFPSKLFLIIKIETSYFNMCISMKYRGLFTLPWEKQFHLMGLFAVSIINDEMGKVSVQCARLAPKWLLEARPTD